jgi:uncharacterized Zn finger protein
MMAITWILGMIKKNPFAVLTWQDLESWVELKTLSRGNAYQKSSAVQDLAVAGKTRLIAWVQGTKRYTTEVEIIAGELSSGCTCPVGIDCKHGVAVLLEYIEALKKIKGLLERTGRKSEWDRFLNDVRVENARKRKLLEILDGLTNRPLIES